MFVEYQKCILQQLIIFQKFQSVVQPMAKHRPVKNVGAIVNMHPATARGLK